MRVSRRGFLGRCLVVGCSARSAVARPAAQTVVRPPGGGTTANATLRAMGATLRRRFPNLHRHFIFEYYAWYGTSPYRHWDLSNRRPPVDIAATSMPLLGPYDSRSREVVERHARWIASTGAGSINVSWWGPGSFSDNAVPALMDVMRDHDIRVTFHLEPYRDDFGLQYAQDVLYLLRRYGDGRRWDCFLLLDHADGRTGPVFKSFRTIVPREIVDCHGRAGLVVDYTPDATWRAQTDLVRGVLRDDFARVTLLADSLDRGRTLASGFDGIAVYDTLVEPSAWREIAERFSAGDLVFSFSANPGYDAITPRDLPSDSCYRPLPFVPRTRSLDWADADDREHARQLGDDRIWESLSTSLRLQISPELSNSRRGFFLTYITSFNEWHEGHQFEPMKSWADLHPAEQALLYHNAAEGDSRLQRLRQMLALVLQ